MKFGFIKFFFLLLFLFLLSSCNGECRHRKMSEEVIPPSCGERGYTVYTCNDCSFSFESDFVAPEPHALTETLVTPTCTTAGYTLNKCTKCDYSYISAPTSITEHTIVITTISPSCISPGYTVNKCSTCSYEFTTNPIPSLPHNIKETLIPPTCEKEGYTSYACENCSFAYTADFISAKSHVYNSVITQPSCLNEGFTTKSCSICNKQIITDYTAPRGHSYSTLKIRATSSADGYTLYKCNNCDYSYRSDFEYSYSIFTDAYANTSVPIAKGIDVSSYNGELNWSTLASKGIDFAIIRAGSSKTGEDVFFDINYAKARSVGIDIGVYYYVEATSVDEILEEAKKLESIIANKKFEYPIYIDFEKTELGEILGKELLTKMCSAFVEKLQSDGYFGAIYTNNNWLENFFIREDIVSKYDVWYARYVPADKISSPEWDLTRYGTTMGVWQYTDEAKIEGFKQPFDLNLAYKDYPTIMSRYHYNGY